MLLLLSSHIPHKNSEIECTNSKRAPKSHDYHEEPPRPPITRISLPPGTESNPHNLLSRLKIGSRIGGGRSFQHLEAANLKDPRKAAVWCVGVEKTRVHRLFWCLLSSCAHTNLADRYCGLPVCMMPNIKVVRCTRLRLSIFSMLAEFKNEVTCVRGGMPKQKRAHAF
ncbi:hypothetical protein evm_014569 [Chilo suppressalis]|nr:hypothetical protein evm_014569 [Chilo suppressalis]